MQPSRQKGAATLPLAVLPLLIAFAGLTLPRAQEEGQPDEPPPVVWQSWGDEVFQRAREQQKGVLLTVVQPFCQPCEVADREVYTDPVVRLLIDRSWIPVRVDADERPDLDARYRVALSILSRGERGYPVTAFLFPTGEAMWADTFIPAENREARPGMRALLDSMDHFWKRRFPEAQRNAMAVQSAFDKEGTVRREGRADRFLVSSVVDHLIARADPDHGGYGPPPRRQNPTAAELVLLASARRADEGLRRQALEAMRGPVRGALLDRLDGGFHQAIRAEDWSVPWFGKDLVVNATYLHALAEAIRLTGDRELASAADLTVDYVLGTLRSEEGGFHSAQAPARAGADPASYFAWDAEVLAEKLGEKDARWAEVLFGFRTAGEPLLGLPPRFTLKLAPDPGESARDAGLPLDEMEARREGILRVLGEMRASKEPPPVTGKRYLDSTSMACSALLDAGIVLGREDAVEAALETLRRIIGAGRLDRGVHHSLHDPEGSPVLMEDQAHLGNALLDAHEVTGEKRYLKAAGQVAGAILDLFDSPDGAFYDVVEQEEAAGYVRLRRKIAHDSIAPSPVVTAGRLLFRLGHLQGDEALVKRASRALDWAAGTVWQLDLTATSLALAADAALSGPVMIYVEPGEGSAAELRRAALSLYEPAKIIISGKAPAGAAGRGSDSPGLSMCLGDRCTEELTSPGSLSEALARLRSGARPRPAAGQPR